MKNNFWTRIEHLRFVIRSKSMLSRLISRNESTEMESETTKIRYRSLSFHSKILDPPPLQSPFSRSSLATTTRQKVQSAKKGAKKGESATGRVSIFHAISKLASVTRFAELSLQRIEDPKGERRDASSSTLRRRDSNIGCQMAPARRQIFRFEASLSLSTGR